MVNAEDAAMEESLRAAADDVAMELYATGFNAWNQLTFNPPRLGRAEQPDDIFIFTKVLSGNRLDRPKARLSYTTGLLAQPRTLRALLTDISTTRQRIMPCWFITTS